MSCTCNNNCDKNKSNIFSEEAKKRLLEYIMLDKNIIGKVDTEELSDYDKFVMQHDADIESALAYIEDLENRWLEEVKANCGNEAKISKLDYKLKSSEYDYNKAMQINETLVERNKVLSEENHNLKSYIDEILEKHSKNTQADNPPIDTVTEMINNKEKADKLKVDTYQKLFENVTTATITFPQDSKVTIRTRTRYIQ